MNKLVLASALSALALTAAPAFAQTNDDPGAVAQAYINLGYSHLDPIGTDQNTLGGRIGARFLRYFGAEGEASFGLGSDTESPLGFAQTTKLTHQFAGYGVGYLPITPRFDLFARVGYGNTHFNDTINGVALYQSLDSVNYGTGAQYFFTGHDGIRADYTREDYRDGAGSANVWGVSYVRKF